MKRISLYKNVLDYIDKHKRFDMKTGKFAAILFENALRNNEIPSHDDIGVLV